MAQVIRATTAELNNLYIQPGVLGVSTDVVGDLRQGDGTLGGEPFISAEAAGVTSWNSLTGPVAAGIEDLDDVDAFGAEGQIPALQDDGDGGLKLGWINNTGGTTTFRGLSDTPNDFTALGLQFLRINAGETIVEAVELDTTHIGGFEAAVNSLADDRILLASFSDLFDTPASLGSVGQIPAVAAGGATLEFVDQSGSSYSGLSDTPSLPGDANAILRINALGTGVVHVASLAASDIGSGRLAAGRLPQTSAHSLVLNATGSASDQASQTIGSLTEETVPAAGHFLLGQDESGNLRKFDVGDLPTGSGAQDLSDLGDAQIGTPAAREVLKWNGIDAFTDQALEAADIQSGRFPESRLQQVPAQSIMMNPGGVAADRSASSISSLAEEETPAAGHFLLAESGGNLRKIDVGDLPGGGSGAWGSITGTLSSQSDLQTALDGKSATGHNHDSDYYTQAAADAAFAALSHNHDAAYAALSHNHDSDYAALSHNHDSDYAALSHNHDSDYAALSHNHDGDYAALSHGIHVPAADTDGFVLTETGGVPVWAAPAPVAALGDITDVDTSGMVAGVAIVRNSANTGWEVQPALGTDLSSLAEGDILVAGAGPDFDFANLGASDFTPDGSPAVDDVVLVWPSGGGALRTVELQDLPGGGGGAVDSVFSRTGAVVAVAGDYTAAEITNVAAGTISAVTVQAALNELDTEKAATGHDHDGDYAALSHNHDSAYYTQAAADAAFAALSHNHDSAYYTQAAADAAFAAIGHNHDSDYAALSHAHDTDDLGSSFPAGIVLGRNSGSGVLEQLDGPTLKGILAHTLGELSGVATSVDTSPVDGETLVISGGVWTKAAGLPIDDTGKSDFDLLAWNNTRSQYEAIELGLFSTGGLEHVGASPAWEAGAPGSPDNSSRFQLGIKTSGVLTAMIDDGAVTAAKLGTVNVDDLTDADVGSTTAKARGQLLTVNSAQQIVNVPAGANGHFLVPNNAVSNGLNWRALASGDISAGLVTQHAVALQTHTTRKGTTFPVSPSPVAGQKFFRTDHNRDYFYTGSKWLSVDIETYTCGKASAAQGDYLETGSASPGATDEGWYLPWNITIVAASINTGTAVSALRYRIQRGSTASITSDDFAGQGGSMTHDVDLNASTTGGDDKMRMLAVIVTGGPALNCMGTIYARRRAT